MNALVVVDFCGGELQAVKDENNEVWVCIKRICEQLDVNLNRQLAKQKTY
ncbi:MAG: hypothetical protein ACLP66_16570 [Polyangia bacterium]